jgi:hypothetical protein
MIAISAPAIKRIPESKNNLQRCLLESLIKLRPQIIPKEKKIEMYIGCSPTNGMSLTALLMNDESLNKNFGDL